jgi:hypothetical protein
MGVRERDEGRFGGVIDVVSRDRLERQYPRWSSREMVVGGTGKQFEKGTLAKSGRMEGRKGV